MIFDIFQSIRRSRAWVAVAVGILLVTPALFAAPQTNTSKQSTPQANVSKQAVVEAKGMSCPFCAYGVKKHLLQLPGAKNVEVDLSKDQATVDFAPDSKVTDEQIKKAVRDAGFTPGKIEWRNAGQAGQSGSSGTSKTQPSGH